MAEKKQAPLQPVYLFVGDDELKKRTMLERLVKRIGAEADLTFNQQVFDTSMLKDGEELLDACNTLPFASPLRLVVLHDADKAVKALSDALLGYLAAPCATTVLAMTATKFAKNAKNDKLLAQMAKIDPKCIVDCAAKKRTELPALVSGLAKGRGLNIAYDAVQELISRTGSDTVALEKQIEKLANYAASQRTNNLELADIRRLVSRTAAPTTWEFADSVFAGDLARAMLLRSRLRAETPYQLLALCVMRLRELISVRCLLDRGVRDLASAMKRQEWQLRTVKQNAQRYSGSQLRSLLVLAAELDQLMKSGSDPELQLDRFIIAANR